MQESQPLLSDLLTIMVRSNQIPHSPPKSGGNFGTQTGAIAV